MRTTLDIDEPILRAIKSLAAQQGRSMGKVVSDLLAKVLARSEPHTTMRNGFPVFPPTDTTEPATMELVNRLRDGDDL